MWRPENWSDFLRVQTQKWNANPPEWTFDNFVDFGVEAMSKAIQEELQNILDNNSSDQDKLNQLATLVEKLGGLNGKVD